MLSALEVSKFIKHQSPFTGKSLILSKKLSEVYVL